MIALQVALQAAPDAAVEVFGVKGDPAPPAPEEPVVVRARVRGNTWDKAQRELCVYGGPERYRRRSVAERRARSATGSFRPARAQ